MPRNWAPMLARHKPKPSFLSGVAVSVATIILSLMAIVIRPQRYTSRIPTTSLDLGLMFFSEGKVFQKESWGGFAMSQIHRLQRERFDYESRGFHGS